MRPLAAASAPIEAEIIAVLRSLAPWRKLQLASKMNVTTDRERINGLQMADGSRPVIRRQGDS